MLPLRERRVLIRTQTSMMVGTPKSKEIKLPEVEDPKATEPLC
jgi:hypothetical protein